MLRRAGQPQADLVVDRRGQEAELGVLEDEARQRRPFGRWTAVWGDAADRDLACVRPHEADQEPCQGRLAAAVGADDGHAFAGRDIEGEPAQHGRSTTIPVDQVAHIDERSAAVDGERRHRCAGRRTTGRSRPAPVQASSAARPRPRSARPPGPPPRRSDRRTPGAGHLDPGRAADRRAARHRRRDARR